MQTAEQKSAKAITKAVAHCRLVKRGRRNLTILDDFSFRQITMNSFCLFFCFLKEKCAQPGKRINNLLKYEKAQSLRGDVHAVFELSTRGTVSRELLSIPREPDER